MWARLSIVAGLVLGIVVAAALIGGILAFAPVEPLPTIAAPSLAPASATPLPAASTTPSTPPSAAPTASASGGVGAFHIGEAAPPLQVTQVGGGTIDLANLKGKPVWIYFRPAAPPARMNSR